MFMLFHALDFLIRSSNSEKLSWPNSPVLVMLQLVDASVLYGDDLKAVTPLRQLTPLADPFGYSTHLNQLILARQLIDHGANVNAISIPKGNTPLHWVCCCSNVTNLDFVELLLKEGANPNAQDHLGPTLLMYTSPHAPGAAKFLLNWPTTDINTTRSGDSFQALVRNRTVKTFSDKVALPDNPIMVQHQFLLRQWRKIEKMLVERNAHDTGITKIE